MARGRKTGGRRAGTPNKTTAAVKEALTEAFARIGGVEALIEFGKASPAEFYKLWARMLPTEIKAEVAADFSTTTRVDVSHLSDEQLRALASIRLVEADD
jgi:predicted ATPase